VTEVTFSGPLFDGRAADDLREGADAVRHRVAKEGARLANAAFASSIRHGTGRFLGSITTAEGTQVYSTDGYTMTVTADADEDVVTTDIASYGPWLEGSGSRNDTTRFKGYFGFRRAGDELDGRAQSLGDEAMAPFAERMNE